MKRSLLFLSLLLTLPSYARALVDGTAATVGKSLITVQDAYFYRSLQRFREGQASLFQRETGEALRLTVQRMALEEMVSAEMKSFQYPAEGKDDAVSIVKTLKSKREVEFKAFLKKFGKSESQVTERLAKSIQFERFLRKKIETLTPIITEAEAERYFRQNPDKYKGDFASLKGEITQAMKKERTEKGLEEWVRFLKDKYGLTNHLGSG